MTPLTELYALHPMRCVSPSHSKLCLGINAATSAKPDQKPVKTSYRRFGDSLDQEYKRLYGEDEAKRQGKLERKHRMKIWKEVEGTMIEVKFKALGTV